MIFIPSTTQSMVVPDSAPAYRVPSALQALLDCIPGQISHDPCSGVMGNATTEPLTNARAACGVGFYKGFGRCASLPEGSKGNQAGGQRDLSRSGGHAAIPCPLRIGLAPSGPLAAPIPGRTSIRHVRQATAVSSHSRHEWPGDG